MPLIPTINLSGIGTAIGGLIQNQYDLEQRQQQTQIDRAKIDLMHYETTFMNDLKMNYGNDASSWADRYREAITVKANELTKDFKYVAAKDSFSSSMLSVMEQRVPGILQAADQKSQQNAVDGLQYALSQSTSYADVGTSITAFENNKDLLRWAGSSDALKIKLADAYVAKSKELYTQELQNNPISAEKNFRDSILSSYVDQNGEMKKDLSPNDKVVYSKLLSELNPLRTQAANAISSQHKIDMIGLFKNEISDAYKDPKLANDRNALSAKINSINDKYIALVTGKDTAFDFKTAMDPKSQALNASDMKDVINAVDNFKTYIQEASAKEPTARSMADQQFVYDVPAINIAIKTAQATKTTEAERAKAGADAGTEMALRLGRAWESAVPGYTARLLDHASDKAGGISYGAVNFDQMATQVKTKMQSIFTNSEESIRTSKLNDSEKNIQLNKVASAKTALQSTISYMVENYINYNKSAKEGDVIEAVGKQLKVSLAVLGVYTPDNSAIAEVFSNWQAGKQIMNTANPADAIDKAGAFYIANGGSFANEGSGQQSDIKEIRDADKLMIDYFTNQARSVTKVLGSDPKNIGKYFELDGVGFSQKTDNNKRWIKIGVKSKNNANYRTDAGYIFLTSSDDGNSVNLYYSPDNNAEKAFKSKTQYTSTNVSIYQLGKAPSMSTQ